MLCLVALASAFDSDTQPVVLSDSADLFDAADLSTGFVPSGSPVQVQFAIESVGGAHVDMEGTGDLSWPDALTLAFTGTPGQGMFTLNSSLDAVTTVAVDLSDYGYYGTFEIDRRSISFEGRQAFDPFTLGNRVTVSDTTDSTQLINYSYDIFLGVSLDFTATMSPVVTAGFQGVEWDANEAVLTSDNETAALEPAREAEFDVDGLFRAEWDAALDIVFTPTLSVCGPVFGCIDIVSFDVPFDLLTDTFEQDFPAATYSFPLPLLQPGVSSADFGEVPVGAISDVQVPLSDAGDLAAYGTATIEGSTDFTVFPPTFNALPGTMDGLVVTFAPTVEGAQSANLVLTSNDPSYPTLTIPLTGNTPAADDENTDEAGDDGGGAKASGSATTCGCSGAPTPGGSGLLLVAASALLLRRRASRRNAANAR